MTLSLMLLAALAAAPARAEDDGLSEMAAQVAAATRAKTARLSAQAQQTRKAEFDWAPAGWRRDLTGQFPEGEGAQGTIGDCHDFSAVSLLEAALQRGTGKKWVLSTADLFVQRTVLDLAFFGDFIQGSAGPVEGGYEVDDAAYAISRGIASHISYERFQAEYTRYRDTELLPQEKKILGKLPMLRDAMPDRAAFLTRLQIAADMSRRARDTMDALFQKIDPRAAQERARTREALKGYHVAVRTFNDVTPGDYSGAYGSSERAVNISSVLCTRHGAAKALLLRSELDAGRPVAVDLDVSGMIQVKKDGTRALLLPTKAGMAHAIVIEGYASEGPGYLYKIRNWWGSDSIGAAIVGGRLTAGVLHDADMCRVSQMTSVLAPGERSALRIVR